MAKTDARLAAIGDVDEANSAVGGAISAIVSDAVRAALTRVQHDLFDLGADLATPGTNFADPAALRVVASQVARLEEEIDALNADLAPLTSFVLPAGTPAAAALHLARAITRRAERSAVAAAAGASINPLAIAYLNRLSDFLFVAARAVNAAAAGDVLWKPGQTR